MGPRIVFQEGMDRMDVDQALPAPGTRAPGFAIGDADYGNRRIGEDSLSSRIGPTLTLVSFSLATS